MHLRKELEAVLRGVADDEVLPRFRAIASTRKPDGSVVTEADIACQRALQMLLPRIVDCPVLGEEMPVAEQERLWPQHRHALWVVDPVDGTTNFAQGLPLFSVSAALFRNGHCELGVTFLPVLQECFSAEAGHGAFLNEARLSGQPPARDIAETVAAVETKRLPLALTMQLVQHRPFHSLRNVGAGTIDWCWLAAGRFDLLLHGGQKLWDYAAGALIAREAGCCLGGIGGIDFDAQPLWQRSAVAAVTPELFKQWDGWISGASRALLR
jgi:myo-inositol-1(or 4)-monophosphatase